MSGLEERIAISRTHDLEHFFAPVDPSDPFTPSQVDISCSICYPDNTPLTLPWYNFWTWYTTEFPATSYSDQARIAFDYLYDTTGNPNHWLNCIRHLVFSIRYFASPPPLNQIVSRVHTALVQSNLFETTLVNVEQVTTYQPPGESSSDESDHAQPLGFPQPQYNLDNRQDNNDLDNDNHDDDIDIMEEAIPHIRTVLENLVNQKPLPVKTFKGYGADPGEWLQDFEHAANKVTGG